MMIGIIVCGHCHFATGLTSSLHLIMGEQENYIAVDFPAGDTKTELEANIEEAVIAFAHMDQILVMCDLLSGSPFNTAIMLAMKQPNIHVVYGVNLGMLIETVLKRNFDATIEELMETAITTGKQQIGMFELSVDSEEDPFDE